jgi:hypothetical protein
VLNFKASDVHHTHFNISSSRSSSSTSSCSNVKAVFTVLVVYANYCFIAIDVGAVGKASDSNIFKNSDIGRKLESNQLGIAGSRPLPNDDDGKCVSFMIVGDKAYTLSEHVLRPFTNRNLRVPQRIYYRVTELVEW